MKVTLTRRQRWELAHLFLHRGLELPGVDEIRRFNRTRLSLGLTRIMELVGGGKAGHPKLAHDETAQSWELEEGGVDCILERVAKLPLNGYHALVLGDFFESLSTYRTTKVASTCEGADGDAKSEDWAEQA